MSKKTDDFVDNIQNGIGCAGILLILIFVGSCTFGGLKPFLNKILPKTEKTK